jgi:preprotein translocase subunit SecE
VRVDTPKRPFFSFRPFGEDSIDDARKLALGVAGVVSAIAGLLWIDDRFAHRLGDAWPRYGEMTWRAATYCLFAFVGISLLDHFRSFWEEVATELRRVTWPSREDVKRNTLLVIGVMFMFSTTVFVYDKIFQFLFRQVFHFYSDR